MNGVLGMTEFLLSTALTSEQTEYATSVKRSAESLLGVINDILDLSKIEAGKLRLDSRPFEITATVADVAAQFALHARAKGIELQSRIPPVPIFVKGDAGRLRQILTNLIGNAVKFTDAGPRAGAHARAARH